MIDIIICDDEKPYSEILSSKVKKILNELQMEANIDCVTSFEMLDNQLRKTNNSIVFLDIMIGDENSTEWLSNQHYSSDIQFIIMTAFPIEAYKLSEIDCCYYLIKPRLTDEILSKAIKRAVNNISKSLPNYKIVSFGNKNFKINVNDICYIEAFNNNITINFMNDEPITLYSTLKAFKKHLSVNFVHCHKSYLVNMNYVRSYQPYRFNLVNGVDIPIPRKRYNEVVDIYKNYLLNM